MITALERLASNIFCNPYASDGKVGGVFQPAYKVPKSVALTKPIIQINGPRRIAYLCFDIDRRYGGIAWDDANLPPPNFVVVNPTNLHAHIIYELETPIWLPKKNKRQGEALPVRYMKAVRKAMGRALGADPDYNGLLVKNPFHDAWGVSYGTAKPYTLKELSTHLELDSTDPRPADTVKDDSGRRMILFNSARYWAYREKPNYGSLANFHDAIRNELERINSLFSKGPETHGTIGSIAKSVSRYVWFHYDCKRRGIMALDPTESLHIRQQKGQSFTSQLRSDSTLTKIKHAIASLTHDSKPVTKVAVAKLIGMHRNTVARHWPVAVDETVSLRDRSTPSLRSAAAAPRQGDTLMHRTVHATTTPKPPSYPELLIQHNGNILKAAQGAQRYARQGILIDDIPKTFETALRADVDRYRTERSLEMH